MNKRRLQTQTGMFPSWMQVLTFPPKRHHKLSARARVRQTLVLGQRWGLKLRTSFHSHTGSRCGILEGSERGSIVMAVM